MDTKDFIIGAVVGGIVGASAAMLVAPKSGKELRADINDKATTAKDKTVEFTNVAKEKGNEYSQIAKEKSGEWSEVAKEQWNRVADKTSRLTDKANSLSDEMTSDVKNMMEEEKEEGQKLANQVIKEIEETRDKLKDDVTELNSK